VIVAMAKVEILGPRRLLPDVLATLQRAGVLQLRSVSEALGGEPLLPPRPVGEAQAAAMRALEALAARIDALLAERPAAARAAGAASVEVEPLPDVESPELTARLDRLAGERRALDERRARLAEEREVLDRWGEVLRALAELRPSLPGGVAPTSVGLVLTGDRQALTLLEDETRRITGGVCDVQSRELEPGRVAVLLSVGREHAAAVERLLFERSIEEIKLPAHLAEASLVDALALLCRRERELPGEVRALDARIASLAASWRRPLETARREARLRMARLGAAAECAQTPHAFVLYGWLPRESAPTLVAQVKESFGDEVTVIKHAIPPAEYGLVPVVLRNRPLLRPFELLLSLVPPPRYGSIDPTPYLALFFPLFFGLMLGDVGFGLLLLGVAALARRRGWGGESGRRAATVAMACAAGAIVFGVLFGEAFGELGAYVGLHPIVMDRANAFVPSMALALALGTVHILVGIVLGIVHAARAHHVRELLLRTFRLALLLLLPATIASFAGVFPPEVAYGAALTFAALALAALACGGPLGPIELVLTLGNVLSYARLMALGLAAVMLASVANRIAEEVKPFAFGLTIAIVVHAANFVLGLISPTICALRLQYVEFFDKFYEEGGRSFRPFGRES
jgi:V/A-type H+-transporting ATPase subunit I